MTEATRELFLYTSKTKFYLVTSDILPTGEVIYYKNVSVIDLGVMSLDWLIYNISAALKLTHEELHNNIGNDVMHEFGFKSFSDLYKKTNLLSIRVEKLCVKIFKAKKIKRWYEFEQIPPIDGFNIDDDSINKISTILIDAIGFHNEP